MEGEIWKEIEGYEGLYEVSNQGRVKSLTKEWIAGKGAIRYSTKKYTQRQLAIEYNISQYAIMCIVNRKTWKHI